MNCGAKTRRGTPCVKKLKDGKCRHHGKRDGVTIASNLQSHEHEIAYCPNCGEKEGWKSMKCCGCSNYEISTLGKIWNLIRNQQLIGSHKPSGYRVVELVHDNGKHYPKGIHTWQGSTFFGIEAIFGNTKRTYKNEITVDHIDHEQIQNNFVCCNLRPATKTQQSYNQRKKNNINGKAVMKMSLDNEVILKYPSIKQSAKDMGVTVKVITRRCNTNKALGGFRFRYQVKEDLGEQKWISTSDLFPDNASIEGSSEGYIVRVNGQITNGTEHQGYRTIGWRNIKTKKPFLIHVHIIICTLFHGLQPSPNYEVAHINLDGTDNRAVNLMWSKHSSNMLMSMESGKHKTAKKVQQILDDGTTREFNSIRKAALMTGINPSIISAVIKGKRSADKDGNNIRWKLLSSLGNPIKE
uniref:HNH endonuclease n=1 Tax=Pithovirus LCPAC404 TaxID=2506597 RepID=A0A481ZCP2_9VIRU|nr:MAG: HNH endonuclease [Pithovirus LCPAC404]